MAAKHEAFSRTEEGNGVQFSLRTEVLPSNNLKISSTYQDSIKWVMYPVARNYNVCSKKWLQVQNHLAVVRYLGKLF